MISKITIFQRTDVQKFDKKHLSLEIKNIFNRDLKKREGLLIVNFFLNLFILVQANLHV